MRTLIAGSRSIKDYNLLIDIIKSCGWIPTVIISGTAIGIDEMGERYAKENDIILERYPADWKKYGKKAGYIRNELIVNISETAIIIWDGKSKGTKHTIDLIKKNQHIKKFKILNLDKDYQNDYWN